MTDPERNNESDRTDDGWDPCFIERLTPGTPRRYAGVTRSAIQHDPEVLALGRMLGRLGKVAPLNGRDYGADPIDAWMYALAVGWDCEAGCQDPDDPDHSCHGAMDELAERFQWPEWFVDQLRMARIGVRVLLAANNPKGNR